MMGLGYPGGRIIDNLAKGGNPKAVRFPRAQIKKGSYQFSFSGIKTSVWHYLKAQSKEEWQSHLADIAASWLQRHVEANGLLTAGDIRRLLHAHVLPAWAGRDIGSIRRRDIAALRNVSPQHHRHRAADHLAIPRE